LWGSNKPDFATLIKGNEPVDYDPWLVMRFSANPTTIQQGATSPLTADFRYDSNGVFHNPALGHIPDGAPVTFTTTLSNVGSKSVVHYTLNGIATAILYADEGIGKALVSAFADSQDPLTATVTILAATTQVQAANTIGMQETRSTLRSHGTSHPNGTRRIPRH
jgi:autotransporter family porin